MRAHLQQAFLFIWHGKCRISPDKGGHWEIVEPTKQEKDNIIKKINPTEVILNDSLSNCDETIERSLQALKFYQEQL